MITARPILMAAPMVRSTIKGRKTQTRRIANRPTDHFHASYVDAIKGDDGIWYWTDEKQTVRRPVPMRHGKPGDLLYVKETWAVGKCADGLKPRELSRRCWIYENGGLWYEGQEPTHPISPRGAPRSSMFMPRWASRLTLELTDVRVERLQDISEEDAKAEGIARLPNGQWHWHNFDVPGQHGYHTPTEAYDALWVDINGLASWQSNPWVWVLTFKVHHANVDAILAQREEVAA